jgi:hypothetical protein
MGHTPHRLLSPRNRAVQLGPGIHGSSVTPRPRTTSLPSSGRAAVLGGVQGTLEALGVSGLGQGGAGPAPGEAVEQLFAGGSQARSSVAAEGSDFLKVTSRVGAFTGPPPPGGAGVEQPGVASRPAPVVGLVVGGGGS